MKLIFLLSGEHPDLAREEVLGLLKSYGEVEEVDRDEQILVVNFEGDLNVLKRLAMIQKLHSIWVHAKLRSWKTYLEIYLFWMDTSV